MPRKNIKELRQRMSPDRRARNAAAARQMLAEVALSELRKAAGFTQVELSQVLGVSQANLSKLEHQDDMQVGTLRRYIEALGGKLEFVVDMPTGKVRIGPLGEVLEPT